MLNQHMLDFMLTLLAMLSILVNMLALPTSLEACTSYQKVGWNEERAAGEASTSQIHHTHHDIYNDSKSNLRAAGEAFTSHRKHSHFFFD